MQIKGLDFNIQASGEGTPFIWAHGLMSSMESEDRLDWFEFNKFPQQISLVRYDARGHGKSQPTYNPEDYHWHNLSEDMLAIADAIDAKQFIAGGVSMGCATTICAAIRAPERMKALVLVIPPTAWETRAAQGKLYRRLALLGGLLGGKGIARMIGNKMERMFPEWMVREELVDSDGIRQGLSAFKRKTLYNVMRGAASTNLPSQKELESLIDIPVIILAWVGDPSHPISTAEELHRIFPKSELFIAQRFKEFKTIPQRLREFVLKNA